MSSYRTYKLSFLCDSDPAEGATQISDLGSRFTVFFDNPILIPQLAFMVNLKILMINLPNVNPNISAAKGNNTFIVTWNVLDPMTIVVPDGLYNLETLSIWVLQELRRQSNLQGIPITPEDLFHFIENPATHKTVIEFNYDDTVLDFNVENSIASFLGFDLTTYDSSANTIEWPNYVESPNEYDYGTEHYLVKSSDLVKRGLLHNSKYSSIIAKVERHALPGEMIRHEPQNPVYIPLSELRGAKINKLTFLVTDQFDVPINLMNKKWNILFEIEYSIHEQDAINEPIFRRH